METKQAACFSLKHKIILVAFGLILGGGSFSLLSAWYLPSQEGVQFESLEDLRKAMLSPKALRSGAGGSVKLGALVSPHPDNQIIYDLRPNLNVRFQRVPVRTNNCGMRDRNYSHTKDVNTFRLALLGDSFTFGWGVEEDQSFAKILEANLNRISADERKFEVLNFGVPGYSTFQEVAKFLETGHEFQPDAVMVYFISNDFGLPFYVKNLVDPSKGIASVDRFAALQRSKKHQVKAQNYQDSLVVDPNRALKLLSDHTREHGIKLFLAINPRKGWKTNVSKLWILNKRPDIQLIKLRKAFMETYERRNIAEKDLTLTNDPHPSALRHKLLGDILTPHFMEFIDA